MRSRCFKYLESKVHLTYDYLIYLRWVQAEHLGAGALKLRGEADLSKGMEAPEAPMISKYEVL